MMHDELPTCSGERDGYTECHEFPNGLVVDYYSQFGEQYRGELFQVKDDDTFGSFRRKWADVFPDMEVEVSVADLIRARDNHTEQDKIVNELGDGEHSSLIDYLLPPTLVFIILKAHEFLVSHGMVLLQLHNGGNIDVLPDGKWRLKRRNPK